MYVNVAASLLRTTRIHTDKHTIASTHDGELSVFLMPSKSLGKLFFIYFGVVVNVNFLLIT